MAARCPLLADHGYLKHMDGSVTLTRPCEDMTPTAITDLKAALTLLEDRAVNLRVPQPRLWTNLCSAMHSRACRSGLMDMKAIAEPWCMAIADSGLHIVSR